MAKLAALSRNSRALLNVAEKSGSGMPGELLPAAAAAAAAAGSRELPSITPLRAHDKEITV